MPRSAHWARAVPWASSVGQTRKTCGPAAVTPGADDDGEMTGTGSLPDPYTAAAARVVPDQTWPITATTPVSRSALATATALSGCP